MLLFLCQLLLLSLSICGPSFIFNGSQVVQMLIHQCLLLHFTPLLLASSYHLGSSPCPRFLSSPLAPQYRSSLLFISSFHCHLRFHLLSSHFNSSLSPSCFLSPSPLPLYFLLLSFSSLRLLLVVVRLLSPLIDSCPHYFSLPLLSLSSPPFLS